MLKKFKENPPVRSVVQRKLPAEAMVEIDAIAFDKNSRKLKVIRLVSFLSNLFRLPFLSNYARSFSHCSLL
jgi:hypothetical protein